MECKVSLKLIHQHLDGDLSKDQYLQLQSHLNQCPACKERLEQLEKADAMAMLTIADRTTEAHLTEADASRLKSSIMASIPNKKKPEHHKFVRWLYRYPGVSAAAIFFAVMMISIFTSWGQDQQLIVSSSGNASQLVIEGNTVIVPEGVELTGDLTVENGIVEVKGAVSGDVTVIDGKMVLASTGYIAGQSKTIDQVLDWIWYKVTSSVSGVLPY